MASKVAPLTGRVALVTGATRGIGKGIALQLGEAGATVYITGRTLEPRSGASVGGSLNETAEEIKQRGGHCIPVKCDHKIDKEVDDLFERIKVEQEGKLDILVNNVYSAVPAIIDAISKNLRFYEQDINIWDEINNVGLRNHYRCSVHAARLMVPRAQGLIVNVSSVGGIKYVLNGVGKEALDRLSVDMAVELRSKNVAVVSLWPGYVRTEEMMNAINNGTFDAKNETETLGVSMTAKQFLQFGDSTEFSGKAVVSLASDSKVMSQTGQILLTSELANKYKFVDIDGKRIPSLRSIQTGLRFAGWLSTVLIMIFLLKNHQ